jgi:NAD(P)-dependent dehydrogenase (short-subunit alcohol dehydrogenase family)
MHELNTESREKVRFYQLDITNVESIRRLANHIKKKHGGLDILINNAGIAFKVP